MDKGLEHALFYRSENHDRVYNTSSMEHWLKKFFTTGVFTGELQVIANGDMSVKLTGGYVNIGGKVKVYQNDQDLLLETAHATYDRIDSIVIERNDSDRDFFVKVVTGGYSSNPVPLEPVRENGIDQRVVAQIYVAHGAVRITQADITDTRPDPKLCGMVAGTVKEMDFSQFQKQFESYFDNYKTEIADEFRDYLVEIQRLEDAGRLSYDNMVEILNGHTTQFTDLFTAWFDQVKGQLSEDAAGHLQMEIEEVKETASQIESLDFDDTGEVEGIGSFTDFMASFVKGTSIYQFLANLKAGFRYVLHAGQLVNNGLCNTPGKYPLDAAYGKIIQDQLDEIQDNLYELNTGILQELEELPIPNGTEIIYTATKRCDIYVTVLIEAGHSQGAFLINGTTVATVGYAWTATNPARHMLPACFALQKGDVFRIYMKENISIQKVVVRF